MTFSTSARCISLAAGLLLTAVATLNAQTVRAGAVVTGAPYSADAITTVTQVLADGTKIQRSVTAKVYRNSAGQIRREQTAIGLASLTRAADGRRMITITDPAARVTIALDDRARTARRTATPVFFTGPENQTRVFNVPRSQQLDDLLDQLLESRPSTQGQGQQREVGQVVEQLLREAPRGARGQGGTPPAARPAVTALGTRQFDGLSVTGRRTIQTIPAGEVGNDRPIVIVDEVWESDALNVVVTSTHTDPRTGTVEYRLANIVRSEPAADLFTIPAGYTVIDAGTPAPGAGRGRGGRQ